MKMLSKLALIHDLRGWVLCVAVLVSMSATAAEQKHAPKRNVVFILADDLGWGELGCYGQTKIPTPNLDQLAAEGMRFTQHYSGAPVCAPSRCVLMTGLHTGHAEIRGNRQAKRVYPEFSQGQLPLSQTAITLARWFHDHGYVTAAFGKWGLGPVGSTGDPNRQGFDLFFGYNCQSIAHSYYPATLWRNAEQVPLNEHPIPGHQKATAGDVIATPWQGENYAPYRMIDEAEQFLKNVSDKPFFLYLPFIEPHVAMHPPQAALDRFPADWDTEVYRGDSGYLPHPRPHAAYAAMISDLDGYVGRIMRQLRERGLRDSTLVVFSSDNGTTHAGPPGARFHIGGADPAFFNSTQHLRGFKGSVYEGGIRVPLIASLPGVIPPGTVNDSASYFADWFPTLCDAAGLRQPQHLDGESLWATLQDGKPMQRTRPMIWVFPEYGGQIAVRTGQYKLVRRQLKTRQPEPWEVYDLARDPAEEHDLSSKQNGLIAEVTELLRNEIAPNTNFPLQLPGP